MEYYKAFKSLLEKSKDPAAFLAEVPYRRSVPILTEKSLPAGVSELGLREALFVMTDSDVDREGDVIYSSGVEVENFRRFGSILWGHRADKPEFVLGSPAEVIKEDKRILVRASFLGEDVNPAAARVFKMIQAGAVKAMSVGILIRECTEVKERGGWMPLDIQRSELIETSVTPVPVNPRAVLLATSNDEERKEVVELFEEATDTSGQLAASSEALQYTDDQIKALVKETVDELLSKHTVYSVPSGSPDSAVDTLSYFAGLAAQ